MGTAMWTMLFWSSFFQVVLLLAHDERELTPSMSAFKSELESLSGGSRVTAKFVHNGGAANVTCW